MSGKKGSPVLRNITPYLDEVVRLYTVEELTPALISERLIEKHPLMTPTRVGAILKKSGVKLRTRIEALHIAHKTGRSGWRLCWENKPEVVCARCQTPFKPLGPAKFCPECKKGSRSLLYKWGMTQEDWDAQAAKQGGTCALCPEPPEVVDHDHSTGKKRALLCFGCNTRLGWLENVEWREKAFAYIEKHRSSR